MHVTVIGHASLLIEMDGAICLMDPVFFDPFEEGTVVSCPHRVVHVERLPPVDMLILSHRHPDHFDLRSIATVPRSADVIIPPDPLIAHALKRLGFDHVHPVEPMAPIRSESFELFPTRSESRTVREFGMLFKDRSGVFWNQVDTTLSDSTIAAVRKRFGRIDLLFAMYASQNFEFFESRAIEFPWQTHRRNLETVTRIDPRLVVPGSAGFRFCADRAWLNSFLFPISRERFVADLQRTGFAGRTCVMNPGDVVAIEGGAATRQPGASVVAQLVADDTALIAFDPTAAVPDLVDPNPDGRSAAALDTAIASCMSSGLFPYARAAAHRDDRVVAAYCGRHASYAVAVVFPGATRGGIGSTSRSRRSDW